MSESSRISTICAQIGDIQGMCGLWGSKRAYIQLGQPFSQALPCRRTIEQVHCFLQPKFEMSGLWGSNLDYILLGPFVAAARRSF